MDEGVAQTGGVKRTYDVTSNVEISCLRRCGPPPPLLYGIVAKSFRSSRGFRDKTYSNQNKTPSGRLTGRLFHSTDMAQKSNRSVEEGEVLRGD